MNIIKTDSHNSQGSNVLSSATQMSCIHNPKTSKLSCIINQTSYEFLVCKNCRNDPDLQNFAREEKLQ